MPTDACQFFYECEKCKKLLKPTEGDCCVYCSYGSVACPPIQQNGKGGCCSQFPEIGHEELTVKMKEVEQINNRMKAAEKNNEE